MDQIGFHLPAEMLEVYKIKVAMQVQQGRTHIDVPCVLLVALIERTQAWMRLESDERQFQKERDA